MSGVLIMYLALTDPSGRNLVNGLYWGGGGGGGGGGGAEMGTIVGLWRDMDQNLVAGRSNMLYKRTKRAKMRIMDN